MNEECGELGFGYDESMEKCLRCVDRLRCKIETEKHLRTLKNQQNAPIRASINRTFTPLGEVVKIEFQIDPEYLKKLLGLSGSEAR